MLATIKKTLIALLTSAFCAQFALAENKSPYDLNESHFHLTKYIQEGRNSQAFLALMGKKVGCVALFGIPLQQEWSACVCGPENGTTYYLKSDSPLYYYSFTGGSIAMAY